MKLFSNYKLSKADYLNLLIALMPLSFIAGNMIININLILIILSTLFFFKGNLIKIRFYTLDKFLLGFFLLIIITACVNDYYMYSIGLSWRGNITAIINSLLFLKYLFLYLSLRYLIEKEIINLKLFFITASLGSLFVCFDIYYQLINGKDIFGYEIVDHGRKLGGPFGDELIAGGYIQRFSIFSFFTISLFFSQNLKKYLKLIVPILLIIFITGIILSGNRMPLILFLFSLMLISIFHKQVRKYFLLFVFLFSIIFTVSIKFNEQVSNNFKSFVFQITRISNILMDKHIQSQSMPQYLKEFSTFYETWKLNKYIGGGIKNFRYYCHVRDNIPDDPNFVCNMHPHNYYLEILTETGIVGFSIIILIIFILFKISFYDKYISRKFLQNNTLIVPFIFLLIAEIFPIKSTGSFFTTGNTTYIFVIMGVLVGLIRKENLIENKK